MRTFICRSGAELLYCCAVLVKYRRYFRGEPVTDGEETVWHLTVLDEAVPELERFYTREGSVAADHELEELHTDEVVQ